MMKPSGGGGADASHGMAYHFAVSILLLFCLKDVSIEDLAFQYEIGLEKKGYEKFDDIVLRYKKSGGEWIEICVQCKHGEEKIAEDGTITVKNITAADFLSGKNKSFSLVEYIKSFNIVNNNFKDGIERYFIILSNKSYSKEKDEEYQWFNIIDNIDISQLLLPEIIIGNKLKVLYDDNFFISLQKINSKEKLNKKIIEEFCNKFLYICDNNCNLYKEIENKLKYHCKGNEEKIKNLRARLHFLVSEMYQNKISPVQREINDEFHGTNILYKLQSPHQNFTGRVEELDKINEALYVENNNNVLLDVLVTGMAGMGKTELVRKFIDDNKNNYKHIIWINAENKETLENSFIELAKKCFLISDDFKSDFKTVIESIYSHFLDNTLFIFDNADKVLLNKYEEILEWIYLPNGRRQSKNQFIVISQDKQWNTRSKIEVGKFSEIEATEYLLSALKLSSVESTEAERINLAKLFDFWPLALGIAASYINQEAENSLSGNYNISEFISKFDDSIKKLNTHHPQKYEMEPYNLSLQNMWELIEKKIIETNKLAIHLLNLLSYTEPDNIPLDLINHTTFTEDERNSAIILLKNYSLIKICNNEITIHRTLQSVIRNTIIDDKIKETLLEFGEEMFSSYLKNIKIQDIQNTTGNAHMVKLWYYILEYKELTKKYIDSPHLILCKLVSSYDMSIANKFAKHIIKKLKEITSEKDKNLIRIQIIYVKILTEMGKIDEGMNEIECVISICESDSLNFNYEIVKSKLYKAKLIYEKGNYKDALNIVNELLDINYETLDTDLWQHRVETFELKSLILNGMTEYNEAWEINKNLFAIQKKRLGLSNPATLVTIKNCAMSLSNCGKYQDALNLYDAILNEMENTVRDSYPNKLATLNCKALVLKQLGKYEEAINIYNQILTIQNKIPDEENSISMLNIMCNKAQCLSDFGNYLEALEICNYVFKLMSEKLGENHPYVLHTMNIKSIILHKMGRFEESIILLNKVISVRTEMFGEDNIQTLASICSKAILLEEMGKYDEALKLTNNVLNIEKFKLGDDHPSVIKTMRSKAKILLSLEKYDESLDIFNNVILLSIEKLGENHPDTLFAISLKASVLDKLEKYNEALELYDQVINAKKDMEMDRETLGVMNCKGIVLLNLKKFDEAKNIFENVLEIRLNKFQEPLHPNTLDTINNIAHVLYGQKKIDEASKMFLDVYQKRLQTLGANHPSTGFSLDILIELHKRHNSGQLEDKNNCTIF